MLHGVGVPAQVEAPVLKTQPLTAWHALPVVLASQATGVPVHEAVLDQEHLLAARHVMLDVLVEHALATPAPLPLAVFQVHPRSAAPMVLLMLLPHGVGVPLHARWRCSRYSPAVRCRTCCWCRRRKRRGSRCSSARSTQAMRNRAGPRKSWTALAGGEQVMSAWAMSVNTQALPTMCRNCCRWCT